MFKLINRAPGEKCRNEYIIICKPNAYLHVLPEGTGMSVRLVAARYPTVVRLVRSVYVRVLFPVRTVGEPTVASFVLAFERFLAYKNTNNVMLILLLLLLL